MMSGPRTLDLDAGMNTCDTTPQVRPTAVLPDLEPGIGNHARKFWLWRETSDGLDEILVRVAVASEDASQHGDNRERVGLVQPARKISHKLDPSK